MCPHTTVYICPRTTVYMCPHASVYIFVLILGQQARECVRMCPHASVYIFVLILGQQACECVRYICVLILVCPHTSTYMSAYCYVSSYCCYMCPHNRRMNARVSGDAAPLATVSVSSYHCALLYTSVLILLYIYLSSYSRNRRVNALEYVVMPRLEQTVRCMPLPYCLRYIATPLLPPQGPVFHMALN